MNTIESITPEEVRQQIQALKTVFPTVRLLRQTDIPDCSVSCGNKAKCSCAGCAAAKAFSEKKQVSKLELSGNRVFQVIAQYVVVDGAPHVIEMIKDCSGDSQLFLNGRETHAESLTRSDYDIYRDALTGAYDRRYYEDVLKDQSISAGVVMVDLDDFKLCNDTCGHAAGDSVLKTAVDIMRSCVRKSDTVIRFGGDEFVMIMPGINQERFEQQLGYIRRRIHRAGIPGHPGLKLSASIGGVIADNEPLHNAIERADRNMYLAKNRKNTVVTDGTDITADEEKLNVLIVDDSEANRTLLSAILGDEFNILQAANGKEALDILADYGTEISIVLLDIIMPVMNGFEVLKVMNANHMIEDIPVVTISSDNSTDSVREAYEMGVSDYISRPFDAKTVHHRVFNTIKLYAKQRRLVKLVTDQIYEKEKNNSMMIAILSQIVEFRNGESGLHVVHIRTLTEMLLDQLLKKTDRYKLSGTDRLLIPTASALHDIGKIGIDDKILNKPGKLTPEEFEIMKTHSVIGASMLENLGQYQNEELVKVAHDICRWHHERWDGRGYPDGLKGDEIPISAQIVSLADVYDALVSERVYKIAFPHEKAMQMILGGECGCFSPLLLDCLTDIQHDIRARFNT